MKGKVVKLNLDRHSGNLHGVCIEIREPRSDEEPSRSPKPGSFPKDDVSGFQGCEFDDEETFGTELYFTVHSPFGEYPMEELHWFGPETVKSIDYHL